MDSEKEHWQHWDDLPEEKEKQMLDDMANFIVDRDLQLLAQILFESGEPFTRVFSEPAVWRHTRFAFLRVAGGGGLLCPAAFAPGNHHH